MSSRSVRLCYKNGSFVSSGQLVLTVADVEASVLFYQRALRLDEVKFADGRVALAFGSQKINLHPSGSAIEPRALHPKPGSADLCFVSSLSIDEMIEHPRACEVPVSCGPVARTGRYGIQDVGLPPRPGWQSDRTGRLRLKAGDCGAVGRTEQARVFDLSDNDPSPRRCPRPLAPVPRPRRCGRRVASRWTLCRDVS